jgi:hypothetical protein
MSVNPSDTSPPPGLNNPCTPDKMIKICYSSHVCVIMSELQGTGKGNGEPLKIAISLLCISNRRYYNLEHKGELTI